MKKINVLVTGSGSLIGYGAVKLVSNYKFVNKIFAGNIDFDFPAQAFTRNIVVYPDFYFKKESSDEDFLKYVLKFCNENDINTIIPCSIFELEVFAKNIKFFEDNNISVFVEELKTISTFFDKLQTSEFIKKHIKSNYLHTGLLVNDEIPKMNFPYIIKPRYGYGSKDVFLISNEIDFRGWQQCKSKKFSSYIFQEFVADTEGEYSCSVLYDNTNLPYSLCAIKRQLKNGDTIMATYNEECRRVEQQLLQIASKFKGKFCLNFQFRNRDGIPYIFEINPRFAASEVIRSIFGQDPYYQLLSHYYNYPIEKKKRTYGKIVRVYEEIFLS